VIWSVSRGRLNIALIDAAEKAGARFEFDRRLTGATFDDGVMLRFENEAGVASEAHVAFAIGADGAGSALRAAMNAHAPLGERIEPLGHGYKELEIPAASGASRFAIEPNALHIWPRGNYMCIALPNAEGSFTVTLFLANRSDGDAPSFAHLDTPQKVRDFFARDFADAVPLMPDYERDFAQNPTGMLGTLYLDRWHMDGCALLVGDAAHAIVPFHGQGMNCGFEDAVELAELMEHSRDDISNVFAEFQRRRKPNADAIAAMALENYVEMRDSVADARFLLMRALERALADRYPGRFVPRYWMVTFSRLPYATAFARGEVQARILSELTQGKTSLDEIDMTEADALIAQRLPPLPA
jgi:kynurenine 3-monooxygenase